MLTPIENLPIPQRLHSDACWLQHHSPHSQSTLLVYATERDFLSAPIGFAVIELQSEELAEIHQLDTSSYLKQLGLTGELAAGLYRQEIDSATYSLILIDQQQTLDISCQQHRLLTTLYHCKDSRQALIQFLST